MCAAATSAPSSPRRRPRSSARSPLPPGTGLEWGGQFENLQAASQRLAIVVPICFAAIFALLFLALRRRSARAIAVFTAVPLALAGGVFALALRGMPFSISAAVGFIVLSGVAVLNGLVLMTSIRQRLDDGDAELDDAIIEGAMERVRPVLMTALVAGARLRADGARAPARARRCRSRWRRW